MTIEESFYRSVRDLRDTVNRMRNKSNWEETSALLNIADSIESKTQSLQTDIEGYKSTMIAAAEEIQAHWQAHCDAEGYGPANLMHRLEKGIPAQYGYTAGAFEKQEVTISQLRADLSWAKEVLKEARYWADESPNTASFDTIDKIDSLLSNSDKPKDV